MNQFKDFLNDIYPVDNQILDEYIQLWKPYKAARKTILTSPNETERYLYFVVDGVQKTYYLNGSKQHITFFSHAPSFSGVVESFLAQSPSDYFLETVTDSQFIRIAYQVHEGMLGRYHCLEKLFRKAVEECLLELIGRYHELMAFDIETRFKILIERSPHLLNLVPNKDLASYLRIDSTNFSKLLNKVEA